VDTVCTARKKRGTSQSQSYFTTVSQSVRLGVEPDLGLLTRDIFFSKITVLSFGGALSDERSGLSFVSLCHYGLRWSGGQRGGGGCGAAAKEN
jgi:hypothetical protein